MTHINVFRVIQLRTNLVNRQVTFASSKQCEGTKPVKIAQEKSVTPNLLAKSVKIRKWTHVTSSTIMFLRPLMLFCPLTKKRSTTNGPQHRQQQQKVSLSVQASNQHPLSLSFFGCALCESSMIRIFRREKNQMCTQGFAIFGSSDPFALWCLSKNCTWLDADIHFLFFTSVNTGTQHGR
jgi:hypothetical protein